MRKKIEWAERLGWWWHRLCHGEPLRTRGDQPYAIVWQCPCGRRLSESVYPPSPSWTMLAGMKARRESLHLRHKLHPCVRMIGDGRGGRK